MILVTGATGQLGFELKSLLADQAIFLDRAQLDLSRPELLKETLKPYKFKAIINTAAYTQVDLAERQKEIAQAVNTTSAGILAKIAADSGAQFVHYSTDYVFDGQSSKPYVETDNKNPQSVYGQTKSLGEDMILSQCPSALILRTSWVYSSHGKNFIKTILKAGAERDELNVVYDQIGTLTSAHDLAQVTLKSLESKLSGIYHFSGEGVSSWYDVAHFLKTSKRFKAQVNPILSVSYPTPAKRPNFSVLSKEKIKKDLGIRIPHWSETLEKFLGAYHV